MPVLGIWTNAAGLFSPLYKFPLLATLAPAIPKEVGFKSFFKKLSAESPAL